MWRSLQTTIIGLIFLALLSCASSRLNEEFESQSAVSQKSLGGGELEKLSPSELETLSPITNPTIHYGKDYTGEVGDKVFAMFDGTISKVGKSQDLGQNLVRMTCNINGKKWFVDYGHLSAVSVTVGSTVAAGTQIGSMGRDGILPGIPTHVHVQVWRYVDNGVRGFIEPRFEGEK